MVVKYKIPLPAPAPPVEAGPAEVAPAVVGVVPPSPSSLLSALAKTDASVILGYTILDALKEFEDGRLGVLRLVNVKNPTVSYQVRSWNSLDGRAILAGPDQMVLKPILGVREVPLYTPLWT